MGRLTAVMSVICVLGGVATAQAQSTVGEVLEKGGQLVSKADFLEMMPMRIQSKWPNQQGEEELFFSVDGKITGTGHHYASRSDSPAAGTWAVEDDGKVCTPKRFTAWNNSTNNCWYFYRLNNEFFGALKTDAGTRVGKINSMGKQVASN